MNFEFQVDEKEKKSFVVPLSLQLLLENCIKHNFATSQKPLNIRIYSEEGYLLIENNLMAREQVKESAGIGLSNIVQRYSLLTKQNVFIEKSDDFFRVKIPILTQKITAMTTQPSHESIAYDRASKRVKELKGFYGNLISYCLVIPFLIFVNLYTSASYYWFWWPMLGWGIGLVSHSLQVFGIGRNWEEKQIRKILEKENLKKITMENINENDIRYLEAQKRVKKLKGFYIHAIVYVLVNLFLIARNIQQGHSFYDIDVYWTAIFWGIGLLGHSSSIFLPGLFLGKDWEQNKIRELMEKDLHK